MARKFMSIGKMTPDEWYAVPDNPRQRDTEAHARKAGKEHLKTDDPMHVLVHMARIVETGGNMKIDGHTRGKMWHDGTLTPKPATLQVVNWKCDTIEDAMVAYTRFDSQHAVETSGDKIAGAMHQHGIDFSSPLLSERRFGTGLQIAHQAAYGFTAYNRDQIYEIVLNWAEELEMFDDTEPTHFRWPGPLTGAALLLLRAYRNNAIPFLMAWQANAGSKAGPEMDAVMALDMFVRRIRLAKGGVATSRWLLVRAMIAAFLAWQAKAGYRLTATGNASSLRPLSDQMFKAWVAEMNAQRTA